MQESITGEHAMASPKSPGKKEFHPVETIAALAFALSLIGILFHLEWMPYAVVVVLFLGLFVKRASRFLSDAWMRFAVFLGNLNSRIILSIVFFLFLAPIAWIYRLVFRIVSHVNILVMYTLNGEGTWPIARVPSFWTTPRERNLNDSTDLLLCLPDWPAGPAWCC